MDKGESNENNDSSNFRKVSREQWRRNKGKQKENQKIQKPPKILEKNKKGK